MKNTKIHYNNDSPISKYQLVSYKIAQCDFSYFQLRYYVTRLRIGAWSENIKRNF